MVNALSFLLGALAALVVVQTGLLISLYRYFRKHDIYMFTDKWYPVRVKEFPFTLD